jgi:hypothetical protein
MAFTILPPATTTMVDIALKFLRDELASYILARTASSLEEVKLTKIVDDDGKHSHLTGDVVLINLVNVEEERTVKEQLPTYTYIDGQHVVLEPELRLNLHLLFATYFQQYDVGLKYLAYVVTFFQSHSYFTPTKNPGLDSRIEKLVVELQPLGYDQVSQIWTYVGGKQLPSVVYKVRMVAIQDIEPSTIKPPITNIGTTIESTI